MFVSSAKDAKNDVRPSLNPRVPSPGGCFVIVRACVLIREVFKRFLVRTSSTIDAGLGNIPTDGICTHDNSPDCNFNLFRTSMGRRSTGRALSHMYLTRAATMCKVIPLDMIGRSCDYTNHWGPRLAISGTTAIQGVGTIYLCGAISATLATLSTKIASLGMRVML
jgi:hypothetical protein